MSRKEFERVDPEAVGIPSREIQWLVDRLEEEHTQMHGLMIMRDSKICAEGWWAPYAPGLRHGLQSLSKTYAATAVGIACTEGILDLDERVIDIFAEEAPDEPDELLSQLKVRDVLCMGCGMEEMPVPGREWVKDFLAVPVKHKPGTVFMYNSLGSSLLGEMVRKRTGEGLQAYLKTRLFDKIGIDADNTCWLCHPDGMEAGGGGFYACTEDNLRLMKLYLDNGIWEGKRILSEEYVKLATSVQNDSASEVKVNPPAKDNFVGYGFQIWMCRYPGAFRADGAMGQFSIAVPDLDMVISINETAIGAEGIQITLDYVWKFLRKLDASVHQLPEDPEGAEALKKRLKHLALEAPSYAPYREEMERFNGITYEVQPGAGRKGPDFYCQLMKELIGGESTEGISRIGFSFRKGDVRIGFRQDGQDCELKAAMDGTRAYNELHIKGEKVYKVLVSGEMKEPDTFIVTALWPETCYTKTLTFCFEKDMLQIGEETFPLTTTVPGGTRKMMEPLCFSARAVV